MYAVDQDQLKPWADSIAGLDQQLASFELQLPYTCDGLTDAEHNNHGIIIPEHHNNAYWNIVVETHFDQHTTFLTEKTFKPILNLQPFVIVGNPRSLALLKHLGYKTFDSVISEDYDLLQNPQERMEAVLKTCYVLHNSGHNKHIQIQKQLKGILEYNQRHFLAPKTGRIKNFLSQLEY